MSRHDDNLSVRNMLDHAREAVEMAQGRTIGDLASRPGLIYGEALRNGKVVYESG